LWCWTAGTHTNKYACVGLKIYRAVPFFLMWLTWETFGRFSRKSIIFGNSVLFHWHEHNATFPCRSQELLPFLPVIYFSCHSSPPTILPASLTSSCHLFRGQPVGLVVSKFIYNTLLRILVSSILYTCPNQRNLCSLIVSVMVGFLRIA
jgi:hypothetical protein